MSITTYTLADFPYPCRNTGTQEDAANNRRSNMPLKYLRLNLQQKIELQKLAFASRNALKCVLQDSSSGNFFVNSIKSIVSFFCKNNNFTSLQVVIATSNLNKFGVQVYDVISDSKGNIINTDVLKNLQRFVAELSFSLKLRIHWLV